MVPASQLREAYARIRKLERALGGNTMEVEALQAAQDVVGKLDGCAKGPGGDGPPGHGDLPDFLG